MKHTALTLVATAVLAVCATFVANAAEQPPPATPALTPVRVDSAAPLILSNVHRLAGGERIITGGHRTNSLLVEWSVGLCSELKSGTFHSATVEPTAAGWILTVRARNAVLATPAEGKCTALSPKDFQIVPLPSGLGGRKLLDGSCDEPPKCPI